MRVGASIGVAFSAAEAAPRRCSATPTSPCTTPRRPARTATSPSSRRCRTLLHERLRLEADITRALADQEFFLEYQPIVDLGTRSLLGVEALVRWRHPEAGVLMPARFIQVVEECGQIVKLGRWVLQAGVP